MDVSRLQTAIDHLREEAVRLRRWKAEAQADALETAADEFEEALRDWRHEELTVSEAAAESGYAEKTLRRMVREGKIPDSRPPGTRKTIRVRRCDLPQKPAAEREPVSEAVERHVERARRPSGP